MSYFDDLYPYFKYTSLKYRPFYDGTFIPGTVPDDILLKNQRLYKYNFYSEHRDLIENYNVRVTPKQKEEVKKEEVKEEVKNVEEVKKEKVEEVVEEVKKEKEVEEKPPRIILAKLEGRDVYVFISVDADTNAEIFRNILIKKTADVKNDKFIGKVDDLPVIYNQVYQDMGWNTDGYEIVFPYGE